MKTTFPRELPQPVSAEALAEQVGGYVRLANLAGREIRSVSSPEEADSGSLVFCRGSSATSVRRMIRDTRASVIVAAADVDVRSDQGLVAVEDPLAWFIRALGILFAEDSEPTIHPAASIDPGAEIGSRVAVGMGTVIAAGCRIGDDCRIGTHCHIGPGTIIGNHAFVQNHVTIGSVGLGYHQGRGNERLFFPHLGSVIIGASVVIGSGSVIVRGELVDTVIGDRTRIGNLVNVGHNVRIGSDCVLSSNACVAGGVHVGERCNIAVGVAINAKVRIGSDCQIGLGSVVTRDVPAGVSMFGNPAAPLRTMRRF